MKRLPVIIVAASLLVTGFAVPTNPLYVTGYLKTHGHDKKKCVFTVVVKGDQKVLASAKAEADGKFELNFTPTNEKAFDFLYVDSHHAKDTIFLKSYRSFDSDELNVTFYTFKAIRAVDDDDNIVCPKCGHSELVKPMKNLEGYYYCSHDDIIF
jgi:hypothetical protein